MVWPAGRESPALGSLVSLVRERAKTIRRMLPGGVIYLVGSRRDEARSEFRVIVSGRRS
jgi:hypothetical protein